MKQYRNASAKLEIRFDLTSKPFFLLFFTVFFLAFVALVFFELEPNENSFLTSFFMTDRKLLSGDWGAG